MDEPWEVLGKKHRMYRHDPRTTPKQARELFGEYADEACLDHIIRDNRERKITRVWDPGEEPHWLYDERPVPDPVILAIKFRKRLEEYKRQPTQRVKRFLKRIARLAQK